MAHGSPTQGKIRREDVPLEATKLPTTQGHQKESEKGLRADLGSSKRGRDRGTIKSAMGGQKAGLLLSKQTTALLGRVQREARVDSDREGVIVLVGLGCSKLASTISTPPHLHHAIIEQKTRTPRKGKTASLTEQPGHETPPSRRVCATITKASATGGRGTRLHHQQIPAKRSHSGHEGGPNVVG